MPDNNDERSILVRWVYTKEEWKRYMRWKKRKQGLFIYFLHRFFSRSKRVIPEVIVTREKMIQGNTEFYFRNAENKTRRVDIQEIPMLNIISITSENLSETGPLINEISLPVPKGKLREAISLQEILTDEI